jgi:hypothetical protein
LLQSQLYHFLNLEPQAEQRWLRHEGEQPMQHFDEEQQIAPVLKEP